MNATNTQKLLKEFPSLYRGYHYPSNTTMSRGFKCQDGWYRIIYNLSTAIEREAIESGLCPEAIQVKEKFGGLRFYIRGGNEKIQRLIRRAGEQSLKTCECCGEPGEIIQSAWVRVCCKRCQGKRS